MKVAVLLFEEFETLDAFGPVEIFGRLHEQFQVGLYSLGGGTIGNSHGVSIITSPISQISGGTDILLIPGGYGTREGVNDKKLVDTIRNLASKTKYVLTVCTGSALLARTGLLDGKLATSNKKAYEWVVTNGSKVLWQRNARWTVDGKYYTSSGVSAGMDMTLGFIADLHSMEFARKVAREIEYNWIEVKENDPFA